MSTLEYRLFHLRHLPHIQPPGATLFVTFRLTESIPAQARRQLVAEAEQGEARLARIMEPHERARQAYLEQRRLFARWDSALDTAGAGPLWLSDPGVADMVGEALHHPDGRVYDLDAFCIMPNHVHVVFAPLPKGDGTYHGLSAIMHSLKRYTARRANLLLGRRGAFWKDESYDHVVRDEAELQRVVAYVLDNPVKAGLVQHWQEWRWTYCEYG
ncbi:MAG: transposase [Anaerolineae bacterium]